MDAITPPDSEPGPAGRFSFYPKTASPGPAGRGITVSDLQKKLGRATIVPRGLARVVKTDEARARARAERDASAKDRKKKKPKKR